MEMVLAGRVINPAYAWASLRSPPDGQLAVRHLPPRRPGSYRHTFPLAHSPA